MRAGKSLVTKVVAPIAALLISVALLLMGNGLQGTLLPVRASIEAFSALDIGVMGSSYFIGFALGCYYGAHMVRRAGHIRTFTAMVAIASSAVLAHSIIVSPLLWWFLRAITGLCFAVLYLVIESWLSERSTNENRGLVFSIYTFINLTVVTVGQMMLTLDEPTNFPLFALSSILLSLAAVPIAMTTSPAPKPVESVSIRFAHLYRVSPVGIIGCFAVGVANGSFWSLAPLYAQGETNDVTNVAFFMSITVIAGAIGQIPFGRLSDRMDRRRVMLISCMGAALAAGGLVMLDPAWQHFGVTITFLFGLFAFPLYSLSVAHTNDHIDASGYVEAAAGLLLVYALGAIVGPLLAASVMQLVGPSGLFLFTMAIHSAAALFILYRIRQRVAPPLEEHIPFGESLRVSQTVANIDMSTLQQPEPSQGEAQSAGIEENHKPSA
ncbi:MAG: MFS transporter [Gammaproteobacteria bacterium]|nr:MFS transporter [Gammaproteobacteria bacterium]